MAISTHRLNQPSGKVKVSQFGVGTIFLMFAWPAAWYTVLIYVVGRQFIPAGGTTPTWLRLLIIVLGGAADA